MKTELELRHLRVFVSVVESGAYTRAGRALGLSQSTVSETVSALERTLGTPLFRKAARGSRLTPSGEALLPYARRMLDLTGELIAGVAKVSTSVNAVVVVATVESISAYVLPSRLWAWRARWPKAQLEVVTSDCAGIRERVAAGRSDVGLILEAGTAKDEGSVVAMGRLVVFGSPRHRLAGRVATIEQLSGCDFFMSDTAGNFHQVLKHHFESAQSKPPKTQSLGTIEGVKGGIRASHTALGLLPAHAVEPELREGIIAEVRLKPALPGLVLRAVLPSGFSGSPMVEDLIESLRGAPLRGASPRDYS